LICKENLAIAILIKCFLGRPLTCTLREDETEFTVIIITVMTALLYSSIALMHSTEA